mmetsp:Transcript_10690/g.17493  ORF Transcript_10690/g.17493 Transcript_10690/m.17493 type:complete len:261 (+) Transcript_10690:186-968(+)
MRKSCEELHSRLTELLYTRSKALQRRQELADKELRLASLRAKARNTQLEVDEERKKAERLMATKGERSKQLSDDMRLRLSQRQKEVTRSSIRDCTSDTYTYNFILERLVEARRSIISRIYDDILSIRRVDEDSCSICGIGVPMSTDFSATPPRHASAVLGYIVLLVNAIALYLQVPLPFAATYRASRSTIKAASIGDFPLFFEVLEEMQSGRLLRGLEMLHTDLDFVSFCLNHSSSASNDRTVASTRSPLALVIQLRTSL